MIRRYYQIKNLTTNELFLMLRSDFKNDYYENVVKGFSKKLYKVVHVY
jgi:hypothetical protein